VPKAAAKSLFDLLSISIASDLSCHCFFYFQLCFLSFVMYVKRTKMRSIGQNLHIWTESLVFYVEMLMRCGRSPDFLHEVFGSNIASIRYLVSGDKAKDSQVRAFAIIALIRLDDQVVLVLFIV
jgi:hypothetical protein